MTPRITVTKHHHHRNIAHSNHVRPIKHSLQKTHKTPDPLTAMFTEIIVHRSTYPATCRWLHSGRTLWWSSRTEHPVARILSCCCCSDHSGRCYRWNHSGRPGHCCPHCWPDSRANRIALTGSRHLRIEAFCFEKVCSF